MTLRSANANLHGRRWMTAAAAGLFAACVGWLVRHRCSPAVRSWRAGAGGRSTGTLSVRTCGNGDRAVVLLHGLTASGDDFGAHYDQLADDAQLVIPDLLGFGQSLNDHVGDYALQALAALDRMARELDIDGLALTVAGHSLGALLALHWAARRSAVKRVVCFSAPLYAGAEEADERIAAMGHMERLFAPQGAVPRVLCGWMCRHRAIAQWITVALEPQWPVAITRMAVRHSWASYIGAMNGVISHGGWETPLAALEAAHVPVLLADGARDPVPVPGRASQLTTRHRNVTTATHPTARHQLPLTDPNWCVSRLTASRDPDGRN